MYEALERNGPCRAYTTVLTFLGRLESKGYVASDKTGVAHVFRPTVLREALLSQRLARLVDEICEGTATPLVQALVRGRHFSGEDIARFRQLLDDLEKKPGRTTGSRKKNKKQA